MEQQPHQSVAIDDQEPPVTGSGPQAEREFYASYEWCLNPIRTVRDLFDRFIAEIDRYGSLPLQWQRAEALIALYLLSCAIACTLDDYLSWNPFVLTPLTDAYPQLAFLFLATQKFFNLPHLLSSARNVKAASQWRGGWMRLLERVCALLLREEDVSRDELSSLRENVIALRKRSLPKDFLDRRLKLNEGYRCQDLTHHDALTLADRFIATHPPKSAKIVVMGPRTAGTYFAPLISYHLRTRGFNNVSWITLRPKKGLSRVESEFLQRTLSRDCLVLLTDDYSNTGKTFRMTQKIVSRYGVPPENITLLAPLHPTQPVINLTIHPDTRVIALHHEDLHRNVLMAPSAIEPLLKEYLAPAEGDTAILRPNAEVDGINVRLEEHYQDGFQVRLKRLYDVEVRHKNQPPVRKRVLAKSVGWGWLGYHAYLAGTRLNRWVPEVLGLRNGFLFTIWEEGRPWNASEIEREAPDVFASYIVDRTTRLRLPEDPRFEPPDTGWGWLEIARILRKSYGNKLGYLKQKSLIDALRWTVGPFPTLIDGRMRPEEWIRTDQRPVKLDFEHHNFGAPEFDVVDPAYDLAGASFEFRLSSQNRDAMLQRYATQTGDSTVHDRMPLYELMYGTLAHRFSLEKMLRNRPIDNPEYLNERHIRSWSYLVFAMARYTSGLIKRQERRDSNGVLVSLDLDGVLDSEVLGFPHGTPSGLYALTLLHYHGFTVIPNTGRNVEHIRKYCRMYGFPAGVAEYGSVLYDAREDQEHPLIDPEVADQLQRCREALCSVPGVFLDSGYKYSVRAFRYGKAGTQGLSATESRDFLKTFHLDRLAVITRGPDSYFVGAKNSKGVAIHRLRELFNPGRVVAVGDSDEDLPMFNSADTAFAPANASARIHSANDGRKLHVVPQTYQRGLLRIVRTLSEGQLHPAPEDLLERGAEHSVHHLLYTLLSIAEQSRAQRIRALFSQRLG